MNKDLDYGKSSSCKSRRSTNFMNIQPHFKGPFFKSCNSFWQPIKMQVTLFLAKYNRQILQYLGQILHFEQILQIYTSRIIIKPHCLVTPCMRGRECFHSSSDINHVQVYPGVAGNSPAILAFCVFRQIHKMTFNLDLQLHFTNMSHTELIELV